MKVLHITNSLSCEDEGFYSQSLVLGMHRRGYDVTLVAPPGPLTGELESAGVDLETFPFLNQPQLEVFRTKSICTSLKGNNWDLIHGHDLRDNQLVEGVAERLNVPYVITLRTFLRNTKEVQLDDEYVRGIIAPNEALREHGVNDLGISKQLLEVIQPGVEIDRLKEQAVFRRGLDPIIALGTPLVQEKRVEMFLDVAEAVSGGARSIRFLVLKHGPFESEFRKRTRDKELQDQVLFLSNQNAYFDVLPEVDVLLSTDPDLELGLDILHVMGCGKPVISSGAGGAYHAVNDRETGCLVSLSKGPHEMIDRLQFLLQHPEEARRMGKRARRQIEETFTLDRMLDETTSLMTRSLGE